jgi:hypothetical protein
MLLGPESPRWLASQGRNAEAASAASRLWGPGGPAELDATRAAASAASANTGRAAAAASDVEAAAAGEPRVETCSCACACVLRARFCRRHGLVVSRCT